MLTLRRAMMKVSANGGLARAPEADRGGGTIEALKCAIDVKRVKTISRFDGQGLVASTDCIQSEETFS